MSGGAIHPEAAAERAAAIAYARDYCRDLAELLRKRRITALEARILRRRIKAFAEGLEAGLHIIQEAPTDG